ncbi:hypothetical protein [Devosia sp. CAU 1758]
MSYERETIVEKPVHRETVVTGGSPAGLIGGIIAAIVAVLLILWLVNGGMSTTGDTVSVDLPEVTVTE